jgi:hypothetical protein
MVLNHLKNNIMIYSFLLNKFLIYNIMMGSQVQVNIQLWINYKGKIKKLLKMLKIQF